MAFTRGSFRQGALLLLTLGAVLLAAPPPLTIEATPRNGFVGVRVHIRVRIIANEHNRILCLVWGVEEGQNLSCQPVDGVSAPLTYDYERRLEEPGDWGFTAELTRDDRHNPIATTVVRVVGGF